MRWNKIEELYIDKEKSNKPVKVWDAEGNKRTKRHRLNPRQQRAVCIRYAKIVLKKGALMKLRGSVLAIPSDDTVVAGGECFDDLVGGATLIKSIEIAADLQPNNPHIDIIRQNGLQNVVWFRPGTPDDVLLWVKSEANQFSGVRLTIIEVLDEVPRAKAA